MNENNHSDRLVPEGLEQFVSRRGALRDPARRGAVAGALALPLGLAALASRVAAQSAVTERVEEALNFALRLEFLTAEFYATATSPNSAFVFPDVATRTAFTIIRDQEREHVELLRSALGVQAQPKPAFDFTYGGEFQEVFSSYDGFLTVATGLEDMSVRAYKTQLPAVMEDPEVLRLMLGIHSVEARHASKVRRLAGSYGIQGWILGSQVNAPVSFGPIYAGEETVMQGGIDVSEIAGANVTAGQVTEAFDEPLPMPTLLEIIAPFASS